MKATYRIPGIPLEASRFLALFAGRLRDYWLLSKPRVTALVWLTTAGGMYLASREMEVPLALWAHTLIASWFVIASANAFNQVLERDTDALMSRTRLRPLPDGRISPTEAGMIAILWGVLGVAELAWFVHPLTAGIGVLCIALYAFAYTPLKRVSSWCTVVGAIPGAMPPLAGWTAVRGEVSAIAWVLFGVQFLWQFPHLWSIAYLNREDYFRAGLRMMPGGPLGSEVLARRIAVCALMLLPACLLLVPATAQPVIYIIGCLLVSWAIIHPSLLFLRNKSRATARAVMRGSLLFLPAWLILVVTLMK